MSGSDDDFDQDATLEEISVSEVPPDNFDDDDDEGIADEEFGEKITEEALGLGDGEDGMETADKYDEEGAKEVIEDQARVTFRGHKDSVYCVSIHPSRPGVAISGGGDDQAFLWNFLNMETDESSAVKQLGAHGETVTCASFNFDGSLALTGAYDGCVRIWDVATGNMARVLEGPEDIEWAEWHPKGNVVVAGSRDGTVWMWMAHDGQCMQVFAGHDGAVPVGCFTADGRFVCTGGEDGTVRIWAPKTGACKHTFRDGMAHSSNVTCLANSADGTILVSGKLLLCYPWYFP
jgi:ribosome assembly protein SQT1